MSFNDLMRNILKSFFETKLKTKWGEMTERRRLGQWWWKLHHGGHKTNLTDLAEDFFNHQPFALFPSSFIGKGQKSFIEGCIMVLDFKKCKQKELMLDNPNNYN